MMVKNAGNLSCCFEGFDGPAISMSVPIRPKHFLGYKIELRHHQKEYRYH